MIGRKNKEGTAEKCSQPPSPPLPFPPPPKKKQCSCRFLGSSENRAFGRCGSTAESHRILYLREINLAMALLILAFIFQDLHLSVEWLFLVFNPLMCFHASMTLWLFTFTCALTQLLLLHNYNGILWGGGYCSEFLEALCGSVLQTMTLYQTKEFNFSIPFFEPGL